MQIGVCVCVQRLSSPSARSGVWCAERLHHGAVLLHDALRGLFHDVPSDPGAVSHQTVHHLQHAGGKKRWSQISPYHCIVIFNSGSTVHCWELIFVKICDSPTITHLIDSNVVSPVCLFVSSVDHVSCVFAHVWEISCSTSNWSQLIRGLLVLCFM